MEKKITIYDLEISSPFETQADFGRWATFNFNSDLVNSLLTSITTKYNLDLFHLIIQYKHLLSRGDLPIKEFFERIDSLMEPNVGEEAFKLFTKTGRHIYHTTLLLSNVEEFVSINEIDYIIRNHNFPIKVINPIFDFINEDLETKTIACREYLLDVIEQKKDVESVGTTVNMINGDIYKLVVI